MIHNNVVHSNVAHNAVIHSIDLTGSHSRAVHPLSDRFRGTDPEGNEISFTNYYMVLNGKPFFGISGECHFSRGEETRWEDTILKMKIAGLNIISTYIFWNHHEEEEGIFRFDGRRNIRRFIELCAKHGLYVIIRIGPFDHGEVRNGGLPDWLYGKPFEVRSLNDGFLFYTRRLYRKLAEQLDGLYFKDGGPIIGTQIENEYMHSAAPWEMTTGASDEWVPGGQDGEEYMKELKKIAVEEGICTPFYTCTGWGGAAAPTDEMLPLWGGYAYWPWIFYNYRGEHPLTPEYIYRDYHNNEVPKTYNYEPGYEPESLPYACCEMGGGMANYYHYRFSLPFESVDAMANIKLAGGCNFLGYYMFKGGTNPVGIKTYLNECQCPKLSYDYQAAIGEFGQLRPSFHRLRLLHLFVKNFGEEFCRMITVLPEGSQDIRPEDVNSLRYAVRTNGTGGYVFINNFQDHADNLPKSGETISLKLSGETVDIPDISMTAGEEAVLPFGIRIGGYRLIYAKAQPLAVGKENEKTVCFFFMPEGMKPEFVWDTDGMREIDGKPVQGERAEIVPDAESMSRFVIDGEYGRTEIVVLTRKQSLTFYELERNGQKTAVLCDTAITCDGENIYLESPQGENTTAKLYCYPEMRLDSVSVSNVRGKEGNAEPRESDDAAAVKVKPKECGIFRGYELIWDPIKTGKQELEIKKTGPSRYTVDLPEGYEECKELMLSVRYLGDIGHAFIDGTLISDNFCNGDAWEIGLNDRWKEAAGRQLTIFITPLKENSKVNVSSAMAGRMDQSEGLRADLLSVSLKPVYEEIFRIL